MSEQSAVRSPEELASHFGSLASGDQWRLEHFELEGASTECVFEPASPEALAEGLACIQGAGIPTLVRGRGSADRIGNPPRTCELLLSTRSLSGILEFDAQDGVVHVQAGTPLRELRAEVRKGGWELPLDPPGDASVGGALSAAALGPRCLAFGPPRDAVLGLDVVLATGERTRCGGRVVKNVTGYDLAKLYTGAFGTLGVIEAAWLRLRPAAEAVLRGVMPLGPSDSPAALALEAARRPTARAAVLISPDAARSLGVAEPDCGETWSLLVEFAGQAVAAQRDAAWFAEQGPASLVEGADVAALGAELQPGKAAPSDDMVSALGALQANDPGAGGVRARFAQRPSTFSASLRLLRESGASILAQVGSGLIYATWESAEERDPLINDALRVVDECARVGRAEVRIEALPLAHKQTRDVFGDRLPRMLARGLKQRFDPAGVLNPGRFAGRL